MSRFDSLEFEDSGCSAVRRRGAAGFTTGTPVRDAAYFMEVADEEFRAGRLEAALKDYSRALECDSAILGCWLMQVRVLVELQEYKEACVWADRALALFPDHPDLLAAKAVACSRMGMLDKAMAYSDNAMSRSGVTPFTWLSRGEVLLARNSRVAPHCFGQALVVCSDGALRAWAHLEIARVLRAYGRLAQALHHASCAAQMLPGCASALLELGLCQAELGLPAAMVSLEEVLELDPHCDAAEEALVRLRRAGLWTSVKAVLRRLIRRPT